MTRDVFWVERFGRLLRFGRQVALRQYAEKRIRCAMAILEVAGRQVERIRHIDYFILPFDAKGRIDKGEWTRGVRLALEMMPPVLQETHFKQVIDARHRFIQRRYDHKFKWKLTRKMEEEIVAAMLDLR
jgi:hypothetical protein